MNMAGEKDPMLKGSTVRHRTASGSAQETSEPGITRLLPGRQGRPPRRRRLLRRRQVPLRGLQARQRRRGRRQQDHAVHQYGGYGGGGGGRARQEYRTQLGSAVSDGSISSSVRGGSTA